MTSDRRLLDRVAEMEYVLFRDPGHTRQTRYGTFVRHPGFPTRYDCGQLTNVRCAPGDAGRFLEELDRLYGGTRLQHRKISWHDPATTRELVPLLTRARWEIHGCRMMTWRAQPCRAVNLAVAVRVVDPFHPDLVALMTEMGRLDGGFAWHRSQTPRLGGEWLVAYLDGKPVGSTGWFAHGRMARYRFIGTEEGARGRGVATTLMRHVQDHPEVRRQDALVLHVGDDGPVRLYEDLGFRTVGRAYDAMRFLPGIRE